MTGIPNSIHQRFVVSICGGSGCGKSTLAKCVCERIGPDRAVRIPSDFYLRSNPYPTLAEFMQHPLEYDWELVERILNKKDGQVVQVPDYDFIRFHRISLKGSRSFIMRPIVLMDAMIPYAKANLTVFLDAPEDERRRRIAERDQRWKTQVSLNWEQHQRTLEYVHSMDVVFDLVLDARQSVGENVEILIACITSIK